MIQDYYSAKNQIKLRPYLTVTQLLNNFKFKKFFKSIIISGSPRGGTTWLEEVIQRNIAPLYIHEPFFLGRIKEIEQLGFGWMQYIPEDYKNKKMESVLYDIFNGR